MHRHISGLTDEGILAGRQGRWYLSAGFADADIDEALQRMDRATASCREYRFGLRLTQGTL